MQDIIDMELEEYIPLKIIFNRDEEAVEYISYSKDKTSSLEFTSFRLIFLPPPVEARPGRVSEKQMRRVRPQSMYRQNGGRGLPGRSSL